MSENKKKKTSTEKLFDLKCVECYKFFRNPNENERLCPECKKIKESRKQIKKKATSVYQKFSWISRLNDTKDMLEYSAKSYEERGWSDLYVEVAISWAKDIHPNGPEPSSVVTWIRYDGENRILSFGLQQGGSREYNNVDFETAFAFTESDSKGRFVYRNGL